MPLLYDIDGGTREGKRTAQRLLALREAMKGVPQRTISETLLLATWNLREFDSPKYGERTAESLVYIAEIVSHFDLVAVQEVREDLAALRRLRELLGRWWRFLVTDVTDGRAGNRERMAFLYDTRKIRFAGLAGEIVLPPGSEQLARTPYVCGFQAGWFRFLLCTVHILYGAGKPDTPKRVREIRELARFMARRGKDKHAWSKNLILLGDFNIFRPDAVSLRLLREQGFRVPEELQDLPSNALKNKHYDQIAFRVVDKNLKGTGRAGVIDFFDVVYRDGDEKTYAAAMGKKYRISSKGKRRDAAGKRRYYRAWRTFQMSDHLPMWIELKIDFGEAYLERRV